MIFVIGCLFAALQCADAVNVYTATASNANSVAPLQPRHCELLLSSELRIKIQFDDMVHINIDKFNNNISGGYKLSDKLYVHYNIESTDNTDCAYQGNVFCEFTMDMELQNEHVFVKIFKCGDTYKCKLKSDTLEYEIIL